MRDSQSTSVLLSLGSNIGDRAGMIARAIGAIGALEGVAVVRASGMYETDPVGYLEQPAFINAAALLTTARDPVELLGELRAVERALGRVRRERWHEREIDIDILLFGEATVERDELHIPHREMHRRRFVLVPASEIAPAMIHPTLGLTIAELLERCDDTSAVRRIDDNPQQTRTA